MASSRTTDADLTNQTTTAARTAAPAVTLSPSGRSGPLSFSSLSSSAYRVTQARRALPKKVVERSCIVCHRRKVKCDKTVPCANCVRSGVLCCYPSNKRAPRQPKTTIADIASRLVQLERTIVAVAGGDAAGDAASDAGGDDSGDHESDTAAGVTNTAGLRSSHVSATDKHPAAAAAAAAAVRGTLPSFSAALAAQHHRNDLRRSTTTPRSGSGDDDSASMRNGAHSESGAAAQEILLRNAYASRYINEVLLSRVLEEEEEIRSALTLPKVVDTDDAFDNYASDTSAPAVTVFGLLTSSPYIPRSPSMRNSNNKLHPPKRHAMQLWNMFLQNVEPMNKVVHVPTAQISVFTAIHSPDEREPAFESLLFSIYYASVTAYLPDEYRFLFGEDKTVALDRYRAGMERALVQARFLESPSLLTLQALTLFLRTSRAHSPGQSIWIIYGMVLRLAQSIGLHRDGANFGLSPFECEMRRRIWGHMIKQDDRSAEDHGIDVGVPDTGADIQEALNINDSDMYPEIKELPKPQMHWTEMTVSVCIRRLGITVAHMMRLISEMKAAQASGTDRSAQWAILFPELPLTEERRAAIMAERNQYVEDLLKQCSMMVPVQRATFKMSRLIQLKFDFITRLQLATILARDEGGGGGGGGGGGSTNGSSNGTAMAPVIATEENLSLACEVIELNVDIMEDELMQDFRWTAEIYPQYHVLLYVLWHLCVQPAVYRNGNTVLRDRAWKVADGMYAIEDARQKRQEVRGHNSKWTMLMALRDKAGKVRAAVEQGKVAGGRVVGSVADATGAAGAAGAAGTASAGMARGPLSALPPSQAPGVMEGGGSGEHDVRMDDGGGNGGGPGLHAGQVASAYPLASVANNVSNSSNPGGTAFDHTGLAAGYSPPSASTLGSGTASVDPSVGPTAFSQAEFADADMAEFLGGDSTLGMGIDMDWMMRGFMDWNAVANDFRMRTYDAAT
ncbi:hypothetical protein SCUCBS95973_001186 [Sporothrix curviconia]|uniref:Zn(2)-C6 fungal-type domain-containing protein n=1 Tax=Sporothrix curviconia TaxID=1260050 RepID=A0ABP0AWZ9_9PEZI